MNPAQSGGAWSVGLKRPNMFEKDLALQGQVPKIQAWAF